MDTIDPPDEIDDRADLETYLDRLAAQQNEIVRELNRIETMALAADDRSVEAATDVDDLQGQIDRLRDQVDMMDATMPDQQRTKLQKVRSILEYALEEGTRGTTGVKLVTGEVTAAAGSSRQTARRLMDEIGAAFEWAEVKTPGGPNPKELRLAVNDRAVGDLMDDVRTTWGVEA